MVESASWVAVAQPAQVGALLRLGPEPLSFSWACPSRARWAVGLGVAAEGYRAVRWLNTPEVPAPGPWFGGWTFAGRERWVLPEVLGWWANGTSWLAAFGPDGTQARLRERLARVDEVEPSGPPARATVQAGSAQAWGELVRGALGEIDAGRLQKVVVARTLRVTGAAPFDERRLLKALEARFPTCQTYLLRQPDGSALIGSTPETLCEVEGSVLRTEALAGTAPVGQQATLRTSAKDQREHQLVIDGIVASLSPLCVEVAVASEPELLTLSNVVHLRTPIRARLNPGVTALEVAHALHPSPAVAGTPRGEAVRFLAAHEGFDRGWYAGAIGLRGPEALELSVALRCALVAGAEASLFVGAGVVAGSTAEAEWVETARKADAMLGALGVTDA